MILMKYIATPILMMPLATALVVTGAIAERTHPAHRASLNLPICYWRIHPRSHETGNLLAAVAEIQHSLWLTTQPQCGPAPLAQSVNRWRRLLIRAYPNNWRALAGFRVSDPQGLADRFLGYSNEIRGGKGWEKTL